MRDILQRIRAYKLDEIAERKSQHPIETVARDARAAPPVRGFRDALLRAREEERYGLVAEIKKASPSRGLIRADFDPASLARAYTDGGASCLSVLTDAPSFQGRDAYLVAAREACHLPVLRKEFMFDPYQVVESRALGADCILLILAALDDETARQLEEAATDWGMGVLIEVHDEAELKRALDMRSALIGINNRDLRTFETNLEVTERLAPMVPTDKLVISESGIFGPADLRRLAAVGVTSFLVGESLMRLPDVTAATRALLAPASHEAQA